MGGKPFKSFVITSRLNENNGAQAQLNNETILSDKNGVGEGGIRNAEGGSDAGDEEGEEDFYQIKPKSNVVKK